ncbi:VanZ family protein [Paenibacillus sp. LHD-117]|uniref:VanZ family protein n=1 Tax=Paenibacillus sp. LHD-117 TaxID=3071412 RepID=UPI0027DF4CFA|nr:VanZ family protein [Paenibacillus sp. LHD-117]MDQ6422232.1 VanZ family protein [Paenibacillus sp. LHD-117]
MAAVKLFRNAYSSNILFNGFLLLCTVIYTAIMLFLLFYRSRHVYDGYAYNLVPFDTIERYVVYRDHFNFDTWFKNLFGNVVLFIPIGAFLPLFDKRYRSGFRMVTACVTIIACVEIAQMLLHVGSFDIDDILLNTAGAWLGLMLVRPFMKEGRLIK